MLSAKRDAFKKQKLKKLCMIKTEHKTELVKIITTECRQKRNQKFRTFQTFIHLQHKPVQCSQSFYYFSLLSSSIQYYIIYHIQLHFRIIQCFGLSSQSCATILQQGMIDSETIISNMVESRIGIESITFSLKMAQINE